MGFGCICHTCDAAGVVVVVVVARIADSELLEKTNLSRVWLGWVGLILTTKRRDECGEHTEPWFGHSTTRQPSSSSWTEVVVVSLKPIGACIEYKQDPTCCLFVCNRRVEPSRVECSRLSFMIMMSTIEGGRTG